MEEAQAVLPDRPEKGESLQRGYETCDASLVRLAAAGDLRREPDVGMFGCGYAMGVMFAEYGFGGEVDPPSRRVNRGYVECQLRLWEQDLLSPDNQKRLIPLVLRRLLRNMITAEEMYFADSVRYTENVADLDLKIPLSVRVTVRIIGDGYRAGASHLSGVTCRMFIGTEAEVPGHKEGEPWCDS
jgi:hypothetical protein